MVRGRPPGSQDPTRLSRDDREFIRLTGESEGRTLGRLSERKLIIEWLTGLGGSAAYLAVRIQNGDHTRS
jgi:hypothetical protein